MTTANPLHVAKVSTTYLEGMRIEVAEGAAAPYFTLSWGGVRSTSRICSTVQRALRHLEAEDVLDLLTLIAGLAPFMRTAEGSMTMYLRERPSTSVWEGLVPTAPVRTAAEEVKAWERTKNLSLASYKPTEECVA